MKKIFLWLVVVVVCVAVVSSFGLAGCKEEAPAEVAAEEEAPAEVAEEEEATAEEPAETILPELENEYSEEMLSWAKEIKKNYEGTELKFLGFAHPTLDAIKSMTPDWEKLTGVSVNFEETDLAKMYDKFVTDVTTGSNQYDIVMHAEVQAPESWNLGFIEALNPWLENEKDISTPEWFDFEDLSPGYTMMFTSVKDDNTYAIPISGEAALFMYRKDLFEKYNKEVPKTLDELLETAKFFEEQNITEEGREIHGISFRGRPALGGGNWIFSVLIHSFGGFIVDPEDPEKPVLDKYKEETIKTIEYEIELAKYGVPGIAGFDPYDAINAYRQGFSAMVIEASVLAPGVLNPEESVVYDKTGFAALPAGPAGSYNQTFAHGIALTSSSQNKEAAYAFLIWMLSKGNQENLLNNGGTPVRYSGMEDQGNQEKWPYIEATIECLDQAGEAYKDGHYATPQTELILQFISAWAINVSRALSGEITPEVAAENMQNEMEEIVANK